MDNNSVQSDWYHYYGNILRLHNTVKRLSNNNHNPEDRNMKSHRHEELAWIRKTGVSGINPLNDELNPICHLLA
jgi:hypothetical protein